MKFFTAIVLAAAAVNAVALPEANPEAAACDAPGQPCWVIKRAAEAFSDVMAEPNLATRQMDCAKKFQPCWKAKRTAEALASAQEDSSDFTASLSLERRFPEVEPTVEARSPQMDCKKKFQPCWKAKRAAEAEAEASCNMAGEPCDVVKRAVEAVNLIVRAPQMDCQKKFQPCWKAKREVIKLQNFARYVLADQE